MGEVSAQIFLEKRIDGLGWTYAQWIVNFGQKQEPTREDVSIKCAETSQRYMDKQKAVEEAKRRIMIKIQKECGDYPEDDVRWLATG